MVGWALWPDGSGRETRPNQQAAPATAPSPPEPLKVGILHSLTGTFASSGRPLVDALTLAIEEINQSGGVLGRRLQPVLEDGCSDCTVFVQRAEKLITRDGVVALFGCYGSSNRKRVAEVCERYDHLLFYYSDYEGLEQSPCVAYVSGSPNQQLGPAAEWAVRNLDRRRFFLVGSDYVFSRVANAILKDTLASMTHLKAIVAGEAYKPLESADFAEVVRAIRTAEPDMILNTLEGSSNVAFLQALRGSAGPRGRIPVLWFGFGEEEMAVLNPADLQGDYLAGHYFQTLEGKENEAFVAKFRARFPSRRVTDGMLGAYASVYLWKQAVESARSAAPPDVRKALRGQSIATPEGRITLDPGALHAWRTARVGKVLDRLRVQVEFTSPGPIRPEPFPASRPREVWEKFLTDLYEGWGQRWEAPRKIK
jgi:urea transport system substrate-binding protein